MRGRDLCSAEQPEDERTVIQVCVRVFSVATLFVPSLCECKNRSSHQNKARFRPRGVHLFANV